MSVPAKAEAPLSDLQLTFELIQSFRARCGFESLLLCAHAAVLETVRSETVALLRRNFLKGVLKTRADLDADVLYGGLAEDLGGGYFQISHPVRQLLVEALDTIGSNQGEPEYLSCSVARFIRFYAEWARHAHELREDPRFVTYLDELGWVALGFDEPYRAAQSINKLYDDHTKRRGKRLSFGKPAALLALPLRAFQKTLEGFAALEASVLLRADGKHEEADEKIAPFRDLPATLNLSASSDDSAKTFGDLLANEPGQTSSLPRKSVPKQPERSAKVAEMVDVPRAAGDVPDAPEENPLHVAIESRNIVQFKLELPGAGHWLNAVGRNGTTPLTSAIEQGLLDYVELLIAAGADINRHDNNGPTPLIKAIEADRDDIIERLLELGADAEGRTLRRSTPLMFACYCGSMQVFRKLMQRGVSVTAENVHGHQPLHYAVSRGNLEIFRALMDRGAHATHTERSSTYLLNRAATGGNPEIIAEVIRLHPDLHIADANGWGPVAMAAFNNHAEAVRLLLEWGANPNRTTHDGWSPLMLAAQQDANQSARQLLVMGSDVNLRNAGGFTALLSACYWGNAATVKVLLSSPDLDASATLPTQMSPLHLAVASEKGSFETVSALLGDVRFEPNPVLGEEFNSQPSGEGTPLWAAYKLGRWEVFAALCKHPSVNVAFLVRGEALIHRAIADNQVQALQSLLTADPKLANLPDRNGMAPLVLALNPATARQKEGAVAADDPYRRLLMLLESKASPNDNDGAAILSSARLMTSEPLALLYEYGARLDVRDDQGRGLLHIASGSLVGWLLAHGLDTATRDKEGLTPLMLALRSNDPAKALVLASVSDPDFADADGWRALHFAAWLPNQDGQLVSVVRTLLSAGAEVNAPTSAGWTPMHLAAQAGNTGVVELLVASRGDVSALAISPAYSPMQSAAEVGASNICSLLDKHGADLNRHGSGTASPLILALRNGQFETAVLLLELGARSHGSDPITGFSPLACFRQRIEREPEADDSGALIVKRLEKLLKRAEDAGI